MPVSRSQPVRRPTCHLRNFRIGQPDALPLKFKFSQSDSHSTFTFSCESPASMHTHDHPPTHLLPLISHHHPPHPPSPTPPPTKPLLPLLLLRLGVSLLLLLVPLVLAVCASYYSWGPSPTNVQFHRTVVWVCYLTCVGNASAPMPLSRMTLFLTCFSC